MAEGGSEAAVGGGSNGDSGQRGARPEGGDGGPAGASGGGQRRPVEVGMKNEAFYEILSGVVAGTPVLIQPPKRADNPFGR